eukprot:TRINITY_DN10785_c0_g1_i1.p1 TRINITY_DN10785_c0_g1~~TRINITY_DN10785_c0_g1_i1.p1  ORF type:complete len:646 (-),score=127.23 TRINITY_DN10785_c0_g1_i1:79-2016(-)
MMNTSSNQGSGYNSYTDDTELHSGPVSSSPSINNTPVSRSYTPRITSPKLNSPSTKLDPESMHSNLTSPPLPSHQSWSGHETSIPYHDSSDPPTRKPITNADRSLFWHRMRFYSALSKHAQGVETTPNPSEVFSSPSTNAVHEDLSPLQESWRPAETSVLLNYEYTPSPLFALRTPPAHVIPPSLFVNPFLSATDDVLSREGTSIKSYKSINSSNSNPASVDKSSLIPEKRVYQSSIITIFTIWNTMMGSSLLALPWGFSQSGFLLSLIIIIVIAASSCYTCWLIVKHSKGADDFSDVIRTYLGRAGSWLAFIASISILSGAIIAYDILMTDSLYLNVNSVIAFITGKSEDKLGDSKYWNKYTAPLPILIAVYLMSLLKNFGILVLANSFGILCIIYNLGFIVVDALATQGIKFDSISWNWNQNTIDKPENINALPLVGSKFYYFAGLLMVSYFIHNCILPIMKNNNPKNNKRDLIAAFTLVTASYILIGAVVYLAYFRLITDPKNDGFPQDFLSYYSGKSIPAIIARFSLFLQLFTVYPLLLFIVRIQFFGLLWGNQYPGLLHVMVLNATLVGLGTCFAIWYPHVGTVLRWAGAVCGFLYVFGMPNMLHLVAMKREEGRIGIGNYVFNGGWELGSPEGVALTQQ